ncbi:MAG: VOC family protein [Micromonosporaceae bacterium]
MRIDHLIYATPDLDVAVADIERRFGVRAAGGGQHIGQGTHNRLLALGPHTYLEVIAPDPEQPEPDVARPYGVDGITDGGLVGWALACDDIAAALSTARAAGFDPGDVIDGHRVTPDGILLRWRLTRSALSAGVVPFLIAWSDTPHPAASAPQGLVLESLRIEHPDPSSVIGPLRALGAAIDVRPAHEAALVARVNGPRGSGEIR